MAYKFAVIAVIGLTASAICMGAAAGFADVALFRDQSRCAVLAAATSRALDWDGGDRIGRAALGIAR
jgi:hypothetical protein